MRREQEHRLSRMHHSRSRLTSSPDGKTLYVSASDGVYAHPVLADGDIGEGAPFGQGTVRSSDGMGIDCAGNLYTTAGQTVTVLTPPAPS